MYDNPKAYIQQIVVGHINAFHMLLLIVPPPCAFFSSPAAQISTKYSSSLPHKMKPQNQKIYVAAKIPCVGMGIVRVKQIFSFHLPCGALFHP